MYLVVICTLYNMFKNKYPRKGKILCKTNDRKDYLVQNNFLFTRQNVTSSGENSMS